jgi:hypothetical protein
MNTGGDSLVNTSTHAPPTYAEVKNTWNKHLHGVLMGQGQLYLSYECNKTANLTIQEMQVH